jgi:hypothetical protein
MKHTMAETEHHDTPILDDEEPVTGWELIARNRSVVAIIDALLSMPPHREFNKSELAEFADVSRKSVHTHLPLLHDLNVVEEVPNTTPTRYRFNTENEVSEALIKLDGAVNNAGPYAGEHD